MKLLAKEPADRYWSAAEVTEDLWRVRYGLPPAFIDTESVTSARPVLPAPPVRGPMNYIIGYSPLVRTPWVASKRE
ncbi:MAG: hypothetical protein M3309_14260, partial [Actinomycetota bacterium]|nr:hypothetical protein [Actinomycetota bacterium]